MGHYRRVLWTQVPKYAEFGDCYFHIVLKICSQNIREEVREEFDEPEQKWDNSVVKMTIRHDWPQLWYRYLDAIILIILNPME